MAKFKKKILLTGLTLAAPLVTTIASACSETIKPQERSGGLNNQASDDLSPGNKKGSLTPRTRSNSNNFVSAQLKAKKAYDAIKETANTNGKSGVLPSTVARNITTLAKANEQIAANSNKIPNPPAGFEYVISAVANDESGTLTIKVALKKGNRFFTATGDYSKTKIDKDVIVSGYQRTEIADKLKAKKAYDAIKETANTNGKSGVLPSTVARNITTLAKANEQIAANSNKIPNPPAGFEYVISAVANDESGTLTIKVALKKGNRFFTATGDYSKTKIDKDVIVSGYQRTEIADKLKAKKAYDAIKETANTNGKSGVLPSTVARNITTLAKANEQIAANSNKIPNPPAGFEYVISAEDKNAEGKLLIKVALKKVGVTGKYFKLDGESSSTPLYKIITISGFKKESPKTQSPLDSSWNDPSFADS